MGLCSVSTIRPDDKTRELAGGGEAENRDERFWHQCAHYCRSLTLVQTSAMQRAGRVYFSRSDGVNVLLPFPDFDDGVSFVSGALVLLAVAELGELVRDDADGAIPFLEWQFGPQ